MPSAQDLILRLRSVTSAFTTDDPVRELDDLELSLKATGTQARKSGREVKAAADDLAAPGFDKAATEAESTARRMRAAAEDMERNVRSGADGIDRATDGIKADFAETGKEAGAEFISNIAEGIGSGQANVNDVISGTLGGLTNLAATLTGPIALGAAGAAAGIGLVFSAIKGESEKAKARLDELRGALDGIADLSSEQARAAIWKTWIEDAQKTTGKIEKVRDVLVLAGVDADEFQDALAGDPRAIDEVVRKTNLTGVNITKAGLAQGDLTEKQQAYLDNMSLVLSDIAKMDSSIGAVRREHEAIEELTGKTSGKTKTWDGNLGDVAETAAAIRRDIEAATKNRTVKITYDTRDKAGRPLNLRDPRGGRGLGTSA